MEGNSVHMVMIMIKLLLSFQETSRPVMCAYKLVKCEFKWFGLQGMVESKIMKVHELTGSLFYHLCYGLVAVNNKINN